MLFCEQSKKFFWGRGVVTGVGGDHTKTDTKIIRRAYTIGTSMQQVVCMLIIHINDLHVTGGC